MKKKQDYLEGWSVESKKTGKRKYYMHRLYSTGDIGEVQSWTSRSSRMRRKDKLIALEPGLIYRQRVFKKKK